MEKRTRTRFKLEEARYFHSHLQKDWRHVPHFEFYLSAFVSAARSVTWIMRYEYGRKEGWRKWFEVRQPPAHLRETLRRMNDLRVRSTKTEPIRTRTSVKINIPNIQLTPEIQRLLQSESPEKFQIIPKDGSNTEADLVIDGRVVATGRIEHVNHEIPEFKGRSSVDVCGEYLSELESLVKECETKFGP